MRQFIRQLMVMAVFIIISSSAFAQCRTAFRLSGSNVNKEWRRLTGAQWNRMLPRGWVDKGFHFYTRAKTRGRDNGVTTPGELESEINRKIEDKAADGGAAGRREIVLNIKNGQNEPLKVIYDYSGRKNAKCELVTLTY
ncbi:MAG TPA: hypothetical protein VII75_11045 [Thermoanaerobaculia bacterium]|nr:hypothetical protein [Thermoanaerobaculia bacterium]